MLGRIWRFTFGLTVGGIVSLIFVFICVNNISFSLNGEKDNTVLVYSEYKDEGIKAYLFNEDISNRVKITSNLDTNKIGTYYINFNLRFLNTYFKLKREIKVIDNIEPVITLNGESEINLYLGNEYMDKGAVANDNYDGDITSNIIVDSNVDTNRVGNYEVKYTINDSSNNSSSVIRKVNVLPKKVINYTQDNKIVTYIKKNNLNISLGYYNLINGKSFYYKENKAYYGASLIKTLDAIYLYDKNLVNDNIKPYIEKTISVSDNDSHKYLINYIGKENFRQYGLSLGATYTLVGGDNYGNTNVKDQIVYLKKLYSITKDNNELKSYFINDYYNYLKLDNIEIMHKYGWSNYWFHDVGIALDDVPYIIVVLTEHGENSYNIINNISKLVYEYHKDNL